MIDQIFLTSEQFMTWWEELNPTDPIDIHEVMTIFFNQEIYEGAI
jgi:hypothetical protein